MAGVCGSGGLLCFFARLRGDRPLLAFGLSDIALVRVGGHALRHYRRRVGRHSLLSGCGGVYRHGSWHVCRTQYKRQSHAAVDVHGQHGVYRITHHLDAGRAASGRGLPARERREPGYHPELDWRRRDCHRCARPHHPHEPGRRALDRLGADRCHQPPLGRHLSHR